MPKAYTDIKNAFLRKGASEKDAEKRAAMIWNSKIRQPGEAAMGPNWEARNAAMKKGKKK